MCTNGNANLHNAQIVQNNEFYIRLQDIQAELSNYSDKFWLTAISG